MEDLAQEAIQAALKGRWKKAEELNLQILATSPQDISALNRLSLAYVQLSKLKEAKRTLKLVLQLDPANPIALKRLKTLKKLKSKKEGAKKLESLFLEEKGKTKIFSLIKLASGEILGELSAGETLELVPKKNLIQVKKGGVYIGTVPDLLAFHLLPLLRQGYRYEIYVWRVEPKNIKVFLRETFRPRALGGLPSFI